MNNDKQSVAEGGSYQELKRKTTIGEVLDTASSFEQAAYDFYTALGKKVSKRLNFLVQDLAAEEKNHVEMFKELRLNPQAQEHIAMQIETPPSDHRFSDYIQISELGDLPDDQAILQYALGREQVAMEQYTSLAKETPVGPVQDLFRYLAHEETRHKQELEKRYYELIHSGGV